MAMAAFPRVRTAAWPPGCTSNAGKSGLEFFPGRFNKLHRLGFTWELPDYRMQVEEGKGRLIHVEGTRPHEKRLRLDPLRQRRFLELVTFRKRRPHHWPRHHRSASERERSLAKWCDTLRGKKSRGVWLRCGSTP